MSAWRSLATSRRAVRRVGGGPLQDVVAAAVGTSTRGGGGGRGGHGTDCGRGAAEHAAGEHFVSLLKTKELYSNYFEKPNKIEMN